MKHFYLLGFLSILIGMRFVQGQEYMYSNHYTFNAGDWNVTIEKRPVVETGSTLEPFPLSFKTERMKVERNDEGQDVSFLTQDISFLEYTAFPSDDPTIKKMIDYINLIVDHFNRDQIKDDVLDKALIDKWEEGKARLKYRYAKYKPSSSICYANVNIKEIDLEATLPFFIMASSGYRLGPTTQVYSPPEIEEGGTGDRIGYVSKLFVVIGDGKVQRAGGYHPLINEEYCILLHRTSGDGYAYCTFSYKDWPEEGYDQPTPFYRWDRDGKLLNQETRSLKFEDFDPMTFLGKPSLKGF